MEQLLITFALFLINKEMTVEKNLANHVRRDALRTMAGFVAWGIAGGAVATTQDACMVQTAASQGAFSPDDALNRLQQGNARFIKGESRHCDLMKQVKATATGQYPIAAVVGCIDSRVPPEMVFDQGIGDIFAARVAGNFVNTDIIGSLEFATKVAGAKLIVVLGHTECGAIKGAVDDVRVGNLTAMLSNIRPSLAKLNYQGVPSSKNKELVQKLADQNAQDAVANLLARSEILRDLVKEGQLKVVSAMHDLSTGKVSWFA